MSGTTTVLVLLDRTEPAAGGGLRPAVLELLTLARQIGGPVHGVWVDGGADASGPDGATLATLGRYGAQVVHVLRTGAADPRSTPVLGAALAAAVEAVGAGTVLTVSGFENKEAVARLAVATGAGVVTDVSGAERDGEGRVVATKTVLAGTWTTRCVVLAPLAVLTVKAGAVIAVPVEAAATPEVRTLDVEVPARALLVEVVERVPQTPSDRPDLGSADTVVVGGRGTEGDFGPLEELADLLGAAVGATRVATDEGWIAREAQIGQTGVTVTPRLYIGAGVSGAVHHRGGMQASGTIVAVNSDPESPIFEIADYGIVGDLFTVLPALTAELRRLV
ncbi:MAG TPA: electron transfer flavoprotein subunit alpha/FixB family protein [Cellulomonas sp.]